MHEISSRIASTRSNNADPQAYISAFIRKWHATIVVVIIMVVIIMVVIVMVVIIMVVIIMVVIIMVVIIMVVIIATQGQVQVQVQGQGQVLGQVQGLGQGLQPQPPHLAQPRSLVHSSMQHHHSKELHQLCRF